MQGETINIALIVFPEKSGSIQNETVEYLRRWIHYAPTKKSVFKNEGDKKPKLMNKEEIALSNASIFSIFSNGTNKTSTHRATSPLYSIPADVSRLVWGYLSPSELANASLVCKNWRSFGQSFLRESILNAAITGTPIKKVIPIRTKRFRKPKWVQFKLKTMIVERDMEPISGFDCLFFIFENPEVTDEIYNRYCLCFQNIYSEKSYLPAIQSMAVGLGKIESILNKEKSNSYEVRLRNESSLFAACNYAGKYVLKKKLANRHADRCTSCCGKFLSFIAVCILFALPIMGLGGIVTTASTYAGVAMIGAGFLIGIMAGFFYLAVDRKPGSMCKC